MLPPHLPESVVCPIIKLNQHLRDFALGALSALPTLRYDQGLGTGPGSPTAKCMASSCDVAVTQRVAATKPPTLVRLCGRPLFLSSFFLSFLVMLGTTMHSQTCILNVRHVYNHRAAEGACPPLEPPLLPNAHIHRP